tara:strand:+ start:323 stop:535 length:213 start_codon:yes stop_codon:yes gene_type:complete
VADGSADETGSVTELQDEVPPQLEPAQLWIEEREGYRLEKWEAYPEPGSVVPYLVLIPDGVDHDNPGATV